MIDTKSFRQEVAQKAAGAAHNARPLFFISDLHLSEAIPKTVAAFEHFIEVTASGADSVFILGDLFEFWVGDDILDDAVADERARFARRMTKLCIRSPSAASRYMSCMAIATFCSASAS